MTGTIRTVAGGWRRSCTGSAGLLVLLGGLAAAAPAQNAPNLLPDPSIEETQQKNQFGVPYAKWGGWLFEGACEFRNGKVARTGNTCAEIVGAHAGKIRLYSPAVTVEPGRYRFSCYIRGLDIGTHAWGLSEDANFADDQYYQLKLTGTFGWRRLELVKDVPEAKEIVARIGLWAPGRLWVDDAELVRVSNDTPLTAEPVVGDEEASVAPPGALDAATAVRCPDCGYRNMPAWGRCYACGETLAASEAGPDVPPLRPLASFEDGTVAPFTPAATAAVEEHATDGRFAMRLDRSYVSWDGAQDWTGYDFLKADTFSAGDTPAELYVEIRDQGTTGYWTRVNYTTVAPPGASTLIVPTDIYVGEKSRPGRPLDKANITRFVFSIGEAKAPVYFDNLRLERDLSDSVKVPGLQAYDFGPGSSPPLRGFTQVSPGTTYSAGRGYGLKDARIWRAFDVLQPDPLYQTFICIESGGFAADVPNGKFHVFVNLDNPSGYWGEYQVYRERTVKANGVEVVHETMDLERFLQRYFRFADVEDRPDENTFDKYQQAYFSEKEFDVEVTDGQLHIEFLGQNWANSVSALVIYPDTEAEAGRRYLDNLRERRRFYFDNYFKRVLPVGNRDAEGVVPDFAPTPEEQARGYAVFARDWMEDVTFNAVPRRGEVTDPLSAFASAGELEPIVFSVYPLRDVGEVAIAVSDLTTPEGASIPASAVAVGVVSHRLSRVTMEGTVYTVAPRFVMPRTSAELAKGVTTTFWLTLKTPATVEAGAYSGTITLASPDGATDTIDLRARIFATPLDELDVPAGPWGSSISIPWYGEDLGDYEQSMYRKCLAKMREYGCTSFSGIPTLNIRGWQDGKPDIDFTRADWEMAEAKAAGFHDIAVNYNGGIRGFDNYRIDTGAMRNAGFTAYTDFLRAVLTEVDAHARAAGWLPAAYNLCDEPIGDAIGASADNARAWRDAAPETLLTTGATSLQSPAPDDPHLPLAGALKIANLNLHDAAAVQAIRDAGSDWAFYNGGNRWTFGTYMYKCVRDYGMRFRLSWHWNNCAGDPYYALDCREDDYAWCVTDADMGLIPTIHFEREIREGIDDYRYMLTLARLLREKPNHPAAEAGRRLIDEKLGAFELGDRDHNAKWPVEEFREYRLALAEAIERLSG
jgi:hypothetical protein